MRSCSRHHNPVQMKTMGQMVFTKYLVDVDDDVDVHNTGDVWRNEPMTTPLTCRRKIGE